MVANRPGAGAGDDGGLRRRWRQQYPARLGRFARVERVPGKVKSHLGSPPEVRSVRVVGGCTSVEILTTLGGGDSAAATRLCTSAAEVAYSKHTNGLTVLSAAGKELAVGIAGASCIGEP